MSEAQEIHIEPRVVAYAPVASRRVGAGHFAKCNKGFTLIELMAVMLVIAVLAGMAIRIAGYVQRRANLTVMQGTFAAVQAALDLYKSDVGYYPASLPYRVSSNGSAEMSNNWILCRALVFGSRKYLILPSAVLRPNVNNGGFTNIFDPFGKPYNYYCSPSTAYFLYAPPPSPADANTGYTLGGQVKVTSYDFFSYGPDGLTYAAPSVNVSPSGNSSWVYEFRLTTSATDDVWP